MSNTLFRPEVLARRTTAWLGPVMLAPRLSHQAFGGFAFAVIVALLCVLFFGKYPRKVRVSGWIVPEGGLVEVFAQQPGVVAEIAIAEGARVAKGDRLAVISTEEQSARLGATKELVERQLLARKESLLEERRNLERLAEQQKRSLSDRLAALDAAEQKLTSEISLQNTRVKSATRTVTRQSALLKDGVASDEHVQSAEEARIEQLARLHALERSRLGTQRDRLEAQGELDDLPLKSQRDIANVDRNVAIVEEQVLELAARRETVVPATVAGVVTSLQAKRGGHADPKTPIASIMPDGSKLEAQLFCSSRAVAFLRVGQRVLLRYEAFPYQKFGHYEGAIASIARSAVSPSELGAQLAGLSRVVGTNEPTYSVIVALSAQSVKAYGKAISLQPGMQLDADVVLENRRLVEWMLEPLFTIAGSWKP